MPRYRRTPTLNIAEFEALSELLSFSVLLLDHDTNLKFASSAAPRLFGSPDADDLKRRWQDCYMRLQLPDLLQLPKNGKPLRHRSELRSSNSTCLLRM